MKKLFFVFIALFLLYFLKPQELRAQTQTPTPQAASKPAYPLNTNPDVEQNFHSYTQNVFIETLSTATCFVGGVDMLNPEKKCLGIDPVTKKIGYVENGGGLAQVMGGMIGSTFAIPVSTSHYGQYLASNFGITRTSLAQNKCTGLTDPMKLAVCRNDCSIFQNDPSNLDICQQTVALNNANLPGASVKSGFGTGIGFGGLTPVLKIWTTFRNLTYLLFVLVFVILGLGIMFRVNIDARTVMTIQNQIPKIIIALVLITLSYAIAGFLIDMMYVAIYVMIHIFDSQGLATLTHIDTNPIMAIGPLGGINGIATPAAQGVGGMVRSLFDGSVGNWIGGLVGAMIGGFLGSSSSIPFGGLVGGIGGFVVGAIMGNKLLGFIAFAIAYLIISIAILSALFRVWFMLIKAYIFIFLDVIFAPFWIVGGILPGAPGGVGPWIRSLIANLSAFPAVIVLFMIGKTIQEQTSTTGGLFVPPLIGDPGADAGAAIGSLIGLGIILIMPEAVTITKSTLKAPELKYTAAVGRAIGVGQGVISKPIGGIKGELFGKDAFGAPKPGSAWAAKRFGKIGQALTGGGIRNRRDANNNEIKSPIAGFNIGLRGKTLEQSRLKRLFGIGKKEKTWRGKLTPEGEKYQNLKGQSDEIKKQGFDSTKHDVHTEFGKTFYKPKVDPRSSGTDKNDGNKGDIDGEAPTPTGPVSPPPAGNPDAGATARTPETNEEPKDQDEQGAETQGSNPQDVIEAARKGAFEGAKQGVKREDISDATKDSVEEGMKRAREEEERRRNEGNST